MLNSHGKSTKAFCNSLQNSFDVEELLVDIYFHFDYFVNTKESFCRILLIL